MIVDKWNPADYHKNSSEQQKWGLELLDKIAFAGNERVIDLGCGDGKITAKIASLVPLGSVLGIDRSEEMIHFARVHYSQENFPNLVFTVQDMRSLSFHEEFDLAFSNAALHWVSDHASLLSSITRGLRKGGRIVAQMGGKGNADEILHTLGTIIKSEKWSPYFASFVDPYTFYDYQEYIDLLQKYGLTIKRLECIPKEMSHQGEGGLAAWIRTTWLPYTRRVPGHLQPEFIREIVDTYITTRHLDKNGTIQVEMVRLEFEAVREM